MKFIASVLAGAALLTTLSGCKEGDTLTQAAQNALQRIQERGLVVYANCPIDAMFTVQHCETRVRQGPFPPPAKSTIDVSIVSVQLQLQGASVTNSAGAATVTLFAGATTVGSASFPYSISNSTIQFSNPSAVNDWIKSFDGVDGFDVFIGDLSVTQATGSNSVIFKPAILGVPVGSASSSWQFAGGGGFSPTPPGNQ